MAINILPRRDIGEEVGASFASALQKRLGELNKKSAMRGALSKLNIPEQYIDAIEQIPDERIQSQVIQSILGGVEIPEGDTPYGGAPAIPGQGAAQPGAGAPQSLSELLSAAQPDEQQQFLEQTGLGQPTYQQGALGGLSALQGLQALTGQQPTPQQIQQALQPAPPAALMTGETQAAQQPQIAEQPRLTERPEDEVRKTRPLLGRAMGPEGKKQEEFDLKKRRLDIQEERGKRQLQLQEQRELRQKYKPIIEFSEKESKASQSVLNSIKATKQLLSKIDPRQTGTALGRLPAFNQNEELLDTYLNDVLDKMTSLEAKTASGADRLTNLRVEMKTKAKASRKLNAQNLMNYLDKLEGTVADESFLPSQTVLSLIKDEIPKDLGDAANKIYKIRQKLPTPLEAAKKGFREGDAIEAGGFEYEYGPYGWEFVGRSEG